MIQRFIVGYDGSDLAREAFAYAVKLAALLKSEVRAVHVMEPAMVPALGGDPSAMLDPMAPPLILPVADEGAAMAERARAAAQLEELGATCRAAGVAYSSRIEPGVLIDVLADEARASDMICVGLKGRFRRAGVGSTTRWLVNHARCPVLVASGPLQPVDRVLAAYDGTEVSSRAAVFARDLAQAVRWPLTILALPRGQFTLESAQEWAKTIAPGAQVVAEGAGGGEAVLIERVVSKDPHALLVMGAYADSWLRDLFTGSTTSHVLTHLKSPIVLVHGG